MMGGQIELPLNAIERGRLRFERLPLELRERLDDDLELARSVERPAKRGVIGVEILDGHFPGADAILKHQSIDSGFRREILPERSEALRIHVAVRKS